MQKKEQIDYEAEAKREDYGLCIEHPVLTSSIPVAHWYLARLRSPFGTPFAWTRQFAKEMPSGYIVDCSDGYYLDDNGEEKKILQMAIKCCPSLFPQKQHVSNEPLVGWKTTKICPYCSKKRLCKDFCYCPMCGKELPQR